MLAHINSVATSLEEVAFNHRLLIDLMKGSF
jgi:hypothetical protein